METGVLKFAFMSCSVCDHPLPSYAKAQLIAGDDVPYYEHGHVLTYICNCNESHGVAMSPFTCTCDAMADPLNPVWRCIYRNVTSACIASKLYSMNRILLSPVLIQCYLVRLISKHILTAIRYCNHSCVLIPQVASAKMKLVVTFVYLSQAATCSQQTVDTWPCYFYQ